MDSNFVFLTCQAGMENFLKREFALRLPSARFSFSQRGFVVFKLDDETQEFTEYLLQLTTVRMFGESLFDVRLTSDELNDPPTRWSPKAFETTVAEHNLLAEAAAQELVSRLCQQLPKPAASYAGLHMFLRDGLNPAGNFSRKGSSKSQAVSKSQIQPVARDEVTNDLRTRLNRFHEKVATELSTAGYLNEQSVVNENAAEGQNILDICLLNPFHFWIGQHKVSLPQQRWSGGVLPVVSGDDAPISRAYYKLREAIIWSGVSYSGKLKVAEIGASPGGSCQWMLEQGMEVIGIDPADIDPLVADHPRFTHIRRRALEVKRRDIADIDWLVSDAILSPAQILGTYEELLKHPNVQPRHLIITLKLPDLNLLDQLEQWKQRVAGWGYPNIRCRQLIFNRQEICLVASRES